MSELDELNAGLDRLIHSDTPALERDVQGLFREEPPTLTRFVQSKEFLGNPPLSAVQYEAVQYIQQVFHLEIFHKLAAESKDDEWLPVRMINFATMEWGKGSGKDHVCRIASIRVAHLLACMYSPQDYYSMPEQDNIHLLNVASTSNQAQRAFYTPLVKMVKLPVFRDLCEPTKNAIAWANGVEQVSGHSDADSQEGLNILLGVADEIDAFKTKEEIEMYRTRGAREPTKSADAIIKMIRTSAATRFPELFKFARISYPRFKGSTIQNLRKQARRDNRQRGNSSRHYVSGPLPTWEVNPRVPGKEAFSDDYDEDPVMARAMYECKPALSENPFFSDFPRVEACSFEVERQPVIINYFFEDGRWQTKFDFKGLYPISGALYAMHGDIAIKRDRAGVAMSHVMRLIEEEQEVLTEDGDIILLPVTLPVVKNDFTVSFEADLAIDHPREIQISWLRELAYELTRRGFSIKSYTFDSFQSTDTRQQLERRGIESDLLSMDRTDGPYRELRDLISEGRLVYPERKLLMEELQGLTKTKKGKVDHPATGSKDEADAFCGSVIGALELGGSEDPDGRVVEADEAIAETLKQEDQIPMTLLGTSMRFDYEYS